MVIYRHDWLAMIKPNFLDLTSSTASIAPESCGNYDASLNITNENRHQQMINFHDLDRKTYIGKMMDSSSPPFPEPPSDVNTIFHSNETSNEVNNGFLKGAPPVSEHNVNSPSGLVTPPILPGTNSGDNQRVLLENVASRLTSVDNQADAVTPTEKQPEFPPNFELPKSPTSLHKELSTPTLPDKSIDHDTPSTVSPPASLPVNTTNSAPVTSVKREEESAASPGCDDAEYAAAARAAVDSVVCALVGNKAPSTTAPYDPALVGTGTDRLYSLSLAPVGKTEPVSLVDIIPSVAVATTTAAISMCTHTLLQASVSQANAEGLATLSCPTCGSMVPVHRLLLRQRSAAEAKHVCEACGRSFVREDKLKRHIISIHTLEKPHVCQICAKAFARKWVCLLFIFSYVIEFFHADCVHLSKFLKSCFLSPSIIHWPLLICP